MNKERRPKAKHGRESVSGRKGDACLRKAGASRGWQMAKKGSGFWLTTENPAIIFEDTTVGRLKKEVWDASEEEIEKILEDYGIPSPPELGKPGSYIQTTVRQQVIENRRKNSSFCTGENFGKIFRGRNFISD